MIIQYSNITNIVKHNRLECTFIALCCDFNKRENSIKEIPLALHSKRGTKAIFKIVYT